MVACFIGSSSPVYSVSWLGYRKCTTDFIYFFHYKMEKYEFVKSADECEYVCDNFCVQLIKAIWDLFIRAPSMYLFSNKSSIVDINC